ncbi:hypothetical protein HB943_02220 [Listeria weihenstephanensis]|uniref:DNA-packaging protein n=1 Tax=Listeria weihenstephanensis TaxID=1006155 RepID=A0A841Z3Z4_9LIST|nr:phage head-tail connector protein [Listeria weihenstephanensis]MBC1499402.1 hypothetical protein [Listeria weihenstephanensis]
MDKEKMLDQVKTRNSISDGLQDDLITDIISDVEAQVLDYIEQNTVPEKAVWIVKNAVLAAFVRTGAEGVKSDSEEGKTQAWDSNDLIKDFKSYLDKYKPSTEIKSGGVVEFLP